MNLLDSKTLVLSRTADTLPVLNKTVIFKHAASTVHDEKTSPFNRSIELESMPVIEPKYLPLKERLPDKAIWICCLRNMDRHFGGLTMPVSSTRYAHFNKLLEAVTDALRPHVLLKSAINKMYRIDGFYIKSLEDLSEGDLVVCCCAYEAFEHLSYNVDKTYIKFLGSLIRREDKRNDQPVKRVADNSRFRDMQISELPASITTYIDIESIFFRATSTVMFRGYSKSKHHPFIVKAMDKKRIKHDTDVVYKEIEIIRRLQGHPNITELIYTVEQKHKMFMVLERLDSDLNDFFKKHGPFSEIFLSHMISLVSSGMWFMHNQKIVHRDIKLQNLLVRYKFDGDTVQLQQIKIADFGLATYLNGKKLHKCCGTPLFMAPELLSIDGYDERIDIWSLGVAMYFMMFYKFPFGNFGMDDKSLFEAIYKNEIQFPANYDYSAEAKDFLTSVLEKNPEKRFIATQLVIHPFLELWKTARS